MAKPRRVKRPVAKKIHLPEDIVGAVDLELFSAAENKVPFAAWSGLVSTLLTQWLRERGISL